MHIEPRTTTPHDTTTYTKPAVVCTILLRGARSSQCLPVTPRLSATPPPTRADKTEGAAFFLLLFSLCPRTEREARGPPPRHRGPSLGPKKQQEPTQAGLPGQAKGPGRDQTVATNVLLPARQVGGDSNKHRHPLPPSLSLPSQVERHSLTPLLSYLSVCFSFLPSFFLAPCTIPFLVSPSFFPLPETPHCHWCPDTAKQWLLILFYSKTPPSTAATTHRTALFYTSLPFVPISVAFCRALSSSLPGRQHSPVFLAAACSTSRQGPDWSSRLAHQRSTTTTTTTTSTSTTAGTGQPSRGPDLPPRPHIATLCKSAT